jgi:hypothetical protein
MQPSWELLGLFSAGSAALGAIATAGIINAFNRRKGRDSEPSAKRRKLSPPSPVKVQAEAAAAATADQEEEQLDRELSLSQAAAADANADADAANQQEQDAPGTPEAEVSGAGHMPQNDSVVDLQKLQELEQRVRPAPLTFEALQGSCLHMHAIDHVRRHMLVAASLSTDPILMHVHHTVQPLHYTSLQA